MKLKTLKDLKLIRPAPETLKQEAIKWVKEDIKDWNAPGGLFQSEIIKRWKKRFNITEEDLK